MLNSWTQELTVATKIARGISEQNGWEFWRLLWREPAPNNHSKRLVWRRALLSPKFPTKEANFSAALQEWEADLDKYEAEYGQAKAISDEDKRAVVLTEAPYSPETTPFYAHKKPQPLTSLCVRWWFHICKQSRCGSHQQRMRVPPHAMTLMPCRLVKSVMAKVRVKEKMEMERRARRAKKKNKRDKQR